MRWDQNKFPYLFLTFVLIATMPLHSQTQQFGKTRKGSTQLDLRSSGRTIADDIAKPRMSQLSLAAATLNIIPVNVPPTTALSLQGGNTLVNDPNFDNIQIFPNTRPFVHSTESETAIVKAKGNLIAAYNSSANIIVAPNPSGPGLVFVRVLIGAYSLSKDEGKTWTSAFFPPVPGSDFTFGDPALAVAPDGSVYFSQLGADADGNSTVQVNKSTDGGETWSPGIVVAIDPGSDKEWIAVGPDGVVYVTWSSFQNDGSVQLRLGISRDGGNTWASRTIFAPGTNPNPKLPQNAIQFTQPTVDQVSNRLYIPFLHFSGSNQDFIRILASDDEGAHFRFLNFNIAGAPSTSLLPITTPGDLTECGVFLPTSQEPFLGAPTANAPPPPPFIPNVRQTIHSGRAFGGSFTGLPRWRNASRMITQPAFFAHAGKFYLAWNNSNSNVLGDSNVGSKILFIRSTDAGKTWSKQIQVNPTERANLFHVLPSLTVEQETGDTDIHIAYYTQHTDAKVDVDLASSHDGGKTFPASAVRRITSTRFGLPPTNIPVPSSANPFDTTNYDRVIAQCYALGEYLAVRSVQQQIYTLWGDDRRLITQPVSKFDPISGQTHPQEDVFFQRLQQ
jgi:hypothetical protein